MFLLRRKARECYDWQCIVIWIYTFIRYIFTKRITGEAYDRMSIFITRLYKDAKKRFWDAMITFASRNDKRCCFWGFIVVDDTYSWRRIWKDTNVLLLNFILLWALCTYAFNATFNVSSKEIKKDTKIRDTIGLCHYTIPGLFIFAHFFLGTLVVVGIFVKNCIWSLKTDYLRPCNDECNMEDPFLYRVKSICNITVNSDKCFLYCHQEWPRST